MVASCGVASAACATTSICRRGVDSLTDANRSSSPAAAPGSSPSHDRSVDFLHKHNSNNLPSKITDLHELLEAWLYSQARPDHSHGRSAKYVGDINKSSFCGCLFLNMGYYWLFSTSSREGFWPCLFFSTIAARQQQLLAVRLWHSRFGGGRWTAACLSRPSLRVPGFFFHLLHGVGRRDILRQLKTQLSTCNTPWQVLGYTP
jgi:hypothetical protein